MSEVVDKKSHAKYSPSSLELLELCPCYAQEQRAGVAAADGTRLHEATETSNLALCQNEDEEDAVNRCIEYRNEVIKSMSSGCIVSNEVLLKVEDMTEGTGDVVIVDYVNKLAALIDWKFGRVPVTCAQDNVQMQGYVLGVFTAYPKIDRVDVHIVGPRMDFLSVAHYKRTDVDAIRRRIKLIIERCEDVNKQPTANEKCCRYCSIKATCPRMGEAALAVVRSTGLPLPSEFEPGRMIRPEDRAVAQTMSYILEDWAKKVREYNIKAVIEDGISIPGFEIKSRKGNTTVVDSYVALKKIIGAYDDITLDELLQACSVSVAQVCDQLYAKAQIAGKKGETKKAIRENVMELLKEVVAEQATVTFLQRVKGKE